MISEAFAPDVSIRRPYSCELWASTPYKFVETSRPEKLGSDEVLDSSYSMVILAFMWQIHATVSRIACLVTLPRTSFVASLVGLSDCQ